MVEEVPQEQMREDTLGEGEIRNDEPEVEEPKGNDSKSRPYS